MSPAATRPGEPVWLLLVHQIPPKPSYLRVKIWRHLQRIGAVALKNTVYVLPHGDESLEHFQWLLREIAAGRGDGTIIEARMVDGMSDAEVEALFTQARGADYDELAKQARALEARLPRRKLGEEARSAAGAELARLERRLAEIAAIDFFAAPGREAVQGVMDQLARRLRGEVVAAQRPPTWSRSRVRGRTWVTRAGVKVDRIASAWLIRRFIDPAARFRFVVAKGHRPARGELRFDMFEAEFTHEGDRCTFEVLLQRFGLPDRALTEIGEIVHDLDVKDGKFGRGDAEGVGRLLDGLCLSLDDDEARLERGGALFDDLHRSFQRRRKGP
jgi:hypothetical protein